TPLVETMRAVAARGEPVTPYLSALAYLGAWGVLSFLVAGWRFKWERSAKHLVWPRRRSQAERVTAGSALRWSRGSGVVAEIPTVGLEPMGPGQGRRSA